MITSVHLANKQTKYKLNKTITDKESHAATISIIDIRTENGWFKAMHHISTKLDKLHQHKKVTFKNT